MVVYAYNLSYSRGGGRRIAVRGQLWQKCKTLSRKQVERKGRDWAQMVEHLPMKLETPSSISSTTKDKLFISLL
jgi:hypothetical protein